MHSELGEGMETKMIKTQIIYCGDSLKALQSFESGIVDLVYLDPPFVLSFWKFVGCCEIRAVFTITAIRTSVPISECCLTKYSASQTFDRKSFGSTVCRIYQQSTLSRIHTILFFIIQNLMSIHLINILPCQMKHIS